MTHIMKVEEVRQRVLYLASDLNDLKRLTRDQHQLYFAVLLAIAEGRCDDPAACAAEVLKSTEIEIQALTMMRPRQ